MTIRKEIIEEFDNYLKLQGLKFEAIILGGSALILLGIINRATQDIDCIAPLIPNDIQKAAKDFREECVKKELYLKENWLNNGPKDLSKDLPSGWQKRSVLIFKGNNLILHALGRIDLLRSKLFAFCDRQQDIEDCLSLKPTRNELLKIQSWLEKRDLNPMWPKHVKISLKILAKSLGYEL